MKRTVITVLAAIITLAAATNAGCGQGAAQDDGTSAAGLQAAPRTAPPDRCAPQGGTITGATSGGGLVVTTGKLGLIKTCPDGQVLVSGSGLWACGVGGGHHERCRQPCHPSQRRHTEPDR